MKSFEDLARLSLDERRRLEQRLLAGGRPANARPAAIPRLDGDTGVLSWAQQGVWLTQRAAPDTTAYHLDLSVRLTGPLDPVVLQRALDLVVHRHDALRTGFAVDDSGAAFATVADRVAVRLPVTDTTEDELAGWAAIVCDAPFDLAAPPLLRAHLMRLGPLDHVLLLVVHHICADGGSAGVLYRDLVSCYDRLAAGGTGQLPPVPVRHLDYAAWHRDQIRDAPAAGVEYWRQHLAGHSGEVDLPADAPPPARFGYRGARVPLHLTEPEVDRLRAIAAGHGATLFMTLLAGVYATVRRFSGHTDLVIGVPVENRDRPELAEQVGLFVNTVPLRVDLAGEPGFATLLRRVRDATLGGLAHRDVPFEQIFRAVSRTRQADRSPLFQVGFTYQERPAFALAGEHFTLRITDLGTRATKHDLTFCLVGADAGLDGYLEYNTERFHPRTARALGTHLRTLLASGAREPDRPVDELPVLSAEQYAEAVRVASGPEPAVAASRPLHELFAEAAERFPNSVAVVAGAERLTFRELDARAEALAEVLRGLGVRPEVPVALGLDESTTRILVAVLGVLKAGGAYVPLDLEHPPARLARVLTLAGVDVVVTAAGFADRVPAGPRHLVDVDSAGPTPRPGPVAQRGMAGPANLAYVLFTSGSTGDPKGVAVEHRQLSAYVMAMIEQLGAPPGVSYAVVQPLTGDSPVTAMWTALVSGGTTYLVHRRQAADPHAMRRLFEEHDIDCLKITPSHLAALPDVLPRRWVVVGGEPADPVVLQRLKAARPECTVVNEYGPTETTVGGVTLEITGAEPIPWGMTPIGRSIAGTQTYLLDRHLEPVAVGAVGEICVGGDCITRGYTGRPDLTARAYVPDPFSDRPGSRLYRTGDLGRLLPDWTIQCLGRVDTQVKVRGYRIEPAEVEKVLNARPEVAFSVVDAAELAPGNTALVAWVLVEPGDRLDPEALRRAARTELPEYMVPSVFVEIHDVPRSDNGKVRRSALPRPVPAEAPSPVPVAGGEDHLHELMAGLWRTLLGRDDVTGADFFGLGGHSLLATRLVSRVQATFGVELPLQAVFARRTIGGLTDELRARLSGGEADPEPIRAGGLDGDLPVSLAQQRMWFLAALDPGVPIYNVPLAYRVVGDLDVAALGQACTRIVARHAVLRSVYHHAGGRLVQRVLPLRPVEVDVVDYPGNEPDALAWLRHAMSRPFDLSAGPLLRLHVARVRDTVSLLLISLHHIVFDRWSAENFHSELAEFYAAARSGDAARVPELPVQYADFARWQQERLTGEAVERQLAYWRRVLADPPPPLRLAGQRTRPQHRRHPGDFVEFNIAEPVREQVQALAARLGATPFMILLAAFEVLIATAGGQRAFIIGTPIANRTRLELEPLIGFFANTLPLRADLSGDPSFEELVTRVRRTALDAYANQDAPFDRIVEELAPRREVNRDPLFDVMFTFQNVPRGGGSQLQDARLQPLPFDEWIAKRDLTLRIEEGGPGYRGVLEFDNELFDAATARRYTEDYADLLNRLLAEPAAPALPGPSGGPSDGRRDGMGDTHRADPARATFRQFVAAAPAKVRLDRSTSATVGRLPDTDGALPVLVQANHPDIDLGEWAADNRQLIAGHLAAEGGLLFRGFRVTSAPDFRRFAATQIDELLDYTERSTPRHQIDERHVYTSTEYPADQHIELHNEMSYAHLWPMRIAFYARKAATEGGATPVADSREVYRRLRPELRAPFEEHGVMYVRNYGVGVDLAWQDAFQTTDPAEVERYCARSGIGLEWLPGGELRTRQVGPAAPLHPATGERVWFNAAHMFHVAALDPAVRTSMRRLLAEDRLPRNAYYGDGTPIPDDVIEEIRAVYRAVAVRFPWRDGDVVLLDNMLACHGREPFRGEREVLVAFGDPATAESVRS
jgi:amino acid adenylation domain-containing protein